MKLTLTKKIILVLYVLTCLLIISCTSTCNGLASKKEIKIEAYKKRDSTQIIFGKSIFAANCYNCHPVYKTDNFLAGVTQRISSNYLRLFLTKQDSLVTAKDKYALSLKIEFGNLGNSHNFKFTEKELEAIIEYLKNFPAN